MEEVGIKVTLNTTIERFNIVKKFITSVGMIEEQKMLICSIKYRSSIFI